jgi:predicted RNA binding protein YcfA (HicA-like mRNA interferase family)
MRLPRDLSGEEMVRALQALGYEPTRQVGSHVRLTTTRDGEHHVTIPLHSSLRVGTLGALLTDLAKHHDLTKDELFSVLFSRE